MILAALTMFACDSERDDIETTTSATAVPATTATTEPADDSSSSDGSSESSGEAPWEPMPYGPCEYDPGCDCDNKTCADACEADADCPGSNAKCIDNACFIDCTIFGEACGQAFPEPAPNGDVFQCGNLNGVDPTKVCHWV